MKSFKIKFFPIDEKGDWIKSDGLAVVDVVAKNEDDAIISAVTRMIAYGDGGDSVARATIDLKARRLTVKAESEKKERSANITVVENNDKLVISTLIVKEE